MQSEEGLTALQPVTNETSAGTVLRFGGFERALASYGCVHVLDQAQPARSWADAAGRGAAPERSFGILLRFNVGIEFLVDSSGSSVWYRGPKGFPTAAISASFSGPVMAYCLRLRGILCLHASVVELEGHCIALMAPSGCGKSTTAAGMLARGHDVLSDDILVLSHENGRFLAQPGYCKLRLPEDSFQTVIGDGVDPGRLDRYGQKLVVDPERLRKVPSKEPRELVAVYTRSEIPPSTEWSIRPVRVQDAVCSYLGNTYPSRYYRLPVSCRASELRQVAALAERIPLREISYGAGLDRLDELCRLIVDDAGAVVRSRFANKQTAAGY